MRFITGVAVVESVLAAVADSKEKQHAVLRRQRQ